MKQLWMCFFLSVVLTIALPAEKVSLRLNFGGTYLLGGDYNKGMQGFSDYERDIIGSSETFMDNMKKLGPGFQAGFELLYHFSPGFAVGLETGYLNASVESSFQREWRNYKITLSPTLSAIPVLIDLNYFLPMGKKWKLRTMAGAGVYISHLDYLYDIQSTVNPYNGEWMPEGKTAIGAKAGVGIEYTLSKRLSLTVEVTGRYAEITGFKGPWKGIYNGVEKSGTDSVLYIYDYDGQYPMIGIYGEPPAGPHHQNVKEATFSLTGVAAVAGIRINL